DNGGFAIFKSTNPANWTAPNLMDAVGFSSIAAGLFKEGNGIPAISATTPLGQYTFYRDITRATGEPKDTGPNENDFLFVDPIGETFGSVPLLGAAGPENLNSPIQRNSTIVGGRLDFSASSSSAPNRVRGFIPVTNGAFGTVSFRDRIVNTTGGLVTRLRFRIISITTGPTPPVGTAEFRQLSSADVLGVVVNDTNTCAATGTPSTAPCTVTVRGTTLEEPPTQTSNRGGGWNSTVSVGVITLSNPLANNASINVQFLVGVQQPGAYRLFLNIEPLPEHSGIA